MFHPIKLFITIAYSIIYAFGSGACEKPIELCPIPKNLKITSKPYQDFCLTHTSYSSNVEFSWTVKVDSEDDFMVSKVQFWDGFEWLERGTGMRSKESEKISEKSIPDGDGYKFRIKIKPSYEWVCEELEFVETKPFSVDSHSPVELWKKIGDCKYPEKITFIWGGMGEYDVEIRQGPLLGKVTDYSMLSGTEKTLTPGGNYNWQVFPKESAPCLYTRLIGSTFTVKKQTPPPTNLEITGDLCVDDLYDKAPVTFNWSGDVFADLEIRPYKVYGHCPTVKPVESGYTQYFEPGQYQWQILRYYEKNCTNLQPMPNIKLKGPNLGRFTISTRINNLPYGITMCDMEK